MQHNINVVLAVVCLIDVTIQKTPAMILADLDQMAEEIARTTIQDRRHKRYKFLEDWYSLLRTTIQDRRPKRRKSTPPVVISFEPDSHISTSTPSHHLRPTSKDIRNDQVMDKKALRMRDQVKDKKALRMRLRLLYTPTTPSTEFPIAYSTTTSKPGDNITTSTRSPGEIEYPDPTFSTEAPVFTSSIVTTPSTRSPMKSKIKILNPMNETLGQLGKALFLECKVDVKPRPTITWYRIINGTSEILNEPQVLTHGQLLLRYLKPTDEGYYTCILDEGIGDPVNQTIKVSLKDPVNFISEPEDAVSVTNGKLLSIDCTAKGYPPPNITWYREYDAGADSDVFIRIENNKHIKVLENGTLTITKAEINDTGRFKCVAQNVDGDAVAKAVEVIVNVPPIIKTLVDQDEKILVNVKEQLSLECEAVGIPQPNITWYRRKEGKQGVERMPQSLVQPSGTLLIQNAVANDSGLYTCVADNGVGEPDNLTVHVSVREGLKFQQMPQDTTVMKGDVLILHCRVTGSPSPIVTWYRTEGGAQVEIKNDKVAGYQTFPNGTLIVDPPKVKDKDLYECKAENEDDAIAKTVQIFVNEFPTLKKPLVNMTTSAGDATFIDCEASGSPTPKITWQKVIPGTNQTEKIDFSNILPNGTLFINNTDADDAGEYICTIDNRIGKPLSQSMHLLVKDKPKIDIGPKDTSGLEGEPLMFDCFVISYPQPNVTWYRVIEGEPVVETLLKEDTNIKIYPNNSLEIKQMSRDLEGTYKCVATNEKGSLSQSAKALLNVGPSFVKPPENTIVLVGKPLYLDCLTTGAPTPKVVWYKLTKGQTSPETIQPSFDNGTLLIEVSTLNEEASYTCQASNGVGEHIQKTVDVLVNEAPRFLEEVQDIAVPVRKPLTIFCNITGIPKPNVTLLKLDKDGTTTTLPLQNSNESYFKEMAEFDDTGDYMCKGTNEYGTVNDTMAVIVYAEPQFTHELVEIIEIDENTTMILDCAASGYPIPIITWYNSSSELEDGENIKIHLNGSLEIVSVSKYNDGAQYNCKAANDYGMINFTVQVKVNVLPNCTNGTTVVCPSLPLDCKEFTNMMLLQDYKVKRNHCDEYNSTEKNCELKSLRCDCQYPYVRDTYENSPTFGTCQEVIPALQAVTQCANKEKHRVHVLDEPSCHITYCHKLFQSHPCAITDPKELYFRITGLAIRCLCESGYHFNTKVNTFWHAFDYNATIIEYINPRPEENWCITEEECKTSKPIT